MEGAQCREVGRHGVIREEAPHHLRQPLSLFGNGLMHPPSQFLLDLRELCPHAITPLDLSDLWAWPDGPRGYLQGHGSVDREGQVGTPRADIPRFSGVLSTGGGVVFSGQLTGEFEAFDAGAGNCGIPDRLRHRRSAGHLGAGVQYVAVSVGIGGVYTVFSGDMQLV